VYDERFYGCYFHGINSVGRNAARVYAARLRLRPRPWVISGSIRRLCLAASGREGNWQPIQSCWVRDTGWDNADAVVISRTSL
jgi:hypothetical protein